MGRRDSNDKDWKRVKKEVAKRDQNVCRLLRVISAKEAYVLKRKAGGSLPRLDPAHFRPVSTSPELCYDKDNIVQLNRYSHTMIDSSRDPVTGDFITKEETEKWWLRILSGCKPQYESLRKKGIIK